jgi:hypothetical protein
VEIAESYKNSDDDDDNKLCAIYAKMASGIDYPPSGSLFIEAAVYNFRRWDVLGICAWYVHDYEAGYDALLKALKARPDSVHTRQNLKYYVGKVQRFDRSLLEPVDQDPDSQDGTVESGSPQTGERQRTADL